MRAHWPFSGVIGTVCLGAAFAVTPAHADQPERDGWTAGFGLGGSYVSWTWADGDRRQEGSGAGNARVAYALEPDLLVGIEWWGWAKDYEIGSTPEDVPAKITLWAANAAVTYFPGDVGFFVRGGLGVALGSAEITPPPTVVFPVSGKSDDTGFSALVAVGYETGITPRLALGGVMHVVYLGIDEGPFNDTLGYGLTVQFNWYW
jgi:Outer membrane protein beta-barrel domain